MRRPCPEAGGGEANVSISILISLVKGVKRQGQHGCDGEHHRQPEQSCGVSTEAVLQIADEVGAREAASRTDRIDERQATRGGLS